MKVYDFKGFPNPARVRLALAEKGLHDDVEFIPVDVPGGEHLKPEFLAINPSAAVPVMQLEDGTILSESTAITEYIDHLAGEPTLTGTSAKERGVIHMVQCKIENGFLDAVAHYFHHATPGLGPDIEKDQNASWGERRKLVAIKTMHWMETQLQDKDYMAGSSFTVADITAFAGFAFAAFAKIDLPEECVKLKAWHQRISARPSVAVLA